MKVKFRSFEKARKFVRTLKLKNYTEWTVFRISKKMPKDIPTNPNRTYKNEWKGWGDWLGNDNISYQKNEYWPFKKARTYARNLELDSQNEWTKYADSGKLPKEIPKKPRNYYRDKGWITFGDWLGNGVIAPQHREYWPFEKARTYARNLELKSNIEWREYLKLGKLPIEIPANPEVVYKKTKEWISWGDWLGTGKISNQIISENFLPWKEAKPLYQKIVKENNIKTIIEWREFVKTHDLPKGLPAYPNNVYTEERIREMMK